MQPDPHFAIPPSTTSSCTPITRPGTQIVRITELDPFVCINAFRAPPGGRIRSDPVRATPNADLNFATPSSVNTDR
jgi:hypothetical protein